MLPDVNKPVFFNEFFKYTRGEKFKLKRNNKDRYNCEDRAYFLQDFMF